MSAIGTNSTARINLSYAAPPTGESPTSSGPIVDSIVGDARDEWRDAYRANPDSGAPDWTVAEREIDGIRTWTVDDAGVATVDDVVTRNVDRAQSASTHNGLKNGALIGGVAGVLSSAIAIFGDNASPLGAMAFMGMTGIVMGGVLGLIFGGGSQDAHDEIRQRITAQAERDGVDDRVDAAVRELEQDGYVVEVSNERRSTNGFLDYFGGKSIPDTLEDRATEVWRDATRDLREANQAPQDPVDDWNR